MKRAQYETRGPVPQDVIHAVDFELPAPAPGELRVRVVAAAINPSDVLTLTGDYGQLPPLPAIGGNEGVGRVEQLGEGVQGFSAGQLVLLPVGCGTWSTHVQAPAAQFVPLPEGADARQLAMLAINPPTALLMLRQFVDLQPGEWVIQNAANSAVGGYLIELAKLRGLKTVNVVRRGSAIEQMQDAPGDVLLVDGDDLAQRVAEATGKAKIRLGIDAVGGVATERLARCVASGGTVVNYGMMSGEPCQISAGSLVFRDVRLVGFWLARWFRHATRAEQAEVYGELTRLIAQGQLQARIAATFPVAAIKEAVAEAARGGRSGKVLVVPGAEE
ncbi:zinc-dependent alcohol dehydrogenase family protein [Aquimonas voraii]|uniref:enoyl-[acyl-carrier-protein] reductase n=1 Tax=Aquimonas voraii TaxID=265719 RepID=A0A1G6XPD7_9GAMM|nr:zinc-dependent alcohol dehydrogenase family protein [Aquimonas voraii]SDD79295.1 NADPH:quinone reductase [Aquimonas voraii]